MSPRQHGLRDGEAVWQTIDQERASLADLLDDLDQREWESPSLCTGWRVRDVAAAKTALESAGVEVNEMWDSGACSGAGFADPDGNRFLLHHRYAPYPDGSTP